MNKVKLVAAVKQKLKDEGKTAAEGRGEIGIPAETINNLINNNKGGSPAHLARILDWLGRQGDNFL